MKAKKILRRCLSMVLVIIIAFTLSPIMTTHATEQSKESGKITFTSKKKTITAGKSYTFKVKVTGSDDKIIWSVSNKKLGTISQQGKFSAKRVGKVTITAKAGSLSAKINVTIKGKQLIAIDPGHQSRGNSNKEAVGPGSKTTKAKVASGTSGVSTRVPEYKLTLAVSLKLREELLKRGYDVVMTRDKNDVNISNKDRALLANKSGADICIRIHADGSSNRSVTGATTLYPSSRNPYVSNLSKASKRLANAVLTSYCEKTGIKNRGIVKRDDLTGTNWSKIPVIVLEMGFMSNPSQDKQMQDKSFQTKMVTGICNGIDRYYK